METSATTLQFVNRIKKNKRIVEYSIKRYLWNVFDIYISIFLVYSYSYLTESYFESDCGSASTKIISFMPTSIQSKILTLLWCECVKNVVLGASDSDFLFYLEILLYLSCACQPILLDFFYYSLHEVICEFNFFVAMLRL